MAMTDEQPSTPTEIPEDRMWRIASAIRAMANEVIFYSLKRMDQKKGREKSELSCLIASHVGKMASECKKLQDLFQEIIEAEDQEDAD